jgi:ACS family glucarate transporter-like MFS transporter
MLHRKRYFIYVFLFAFLSIYSLDRVTMAVAGSSVASEMKLDPVWLGYLFSSYLWLYAVVLLPAGAITDATGARRMSAIAAGFWSLFQALGGVASNFATLLVTRLGLGVFESAANPCAHRALREWTPRTERGLATAIWYAGTNAGPAMGSPVVAWLIVHYGWRSAFIATGTIGFIWVVIWLVTYHPPEQARWLSEAERQKILAERDAGPATAAGAPAIGYKGLLTTTPTMWGLALTQGCINYTSYFFLAWLPGFLQASYHVSVQEAGNYTALPFGISAVLAVVLSAVADKVLTPRALFEGKRRYAVGLGAVASALIVVVPYVGSIGFASVVLTVSLTCNTFAQSMNFALTNDRLRTPGDVGRAYAFFTFGGISFGLAGPIVTGYLVWLTGDFKVALVLCGGLSIVATLLTLLMTRRAMGEGVVPMAAPREERDT